MADSWTKLEPTNEETWDYKNDKELQGVFLSLEENIGPNNSKMYKIQKEDGTTISVWGTTVIDARFKKLKPGYEVNFNPITDGQ